MSKQLKICISWDFFSGYFQMGPFRNDARMMRNSKEHETDVIAA
jgi:hypothetical protein